MELSRAAALGWLKGKDGALVEAVSLQEDSEAWTVDAYAGVRSRLPMLGRAIASRALHQQLIDEAATLDRLRIVLAYLRSRFRLMVLEELGQHEQGGENLGIAVITADGQFAPRTLDAAEGVRTLEQSMRDLRRRQLLGQIFSVENLARVGAALDRLNATSEGYHEA